MLEPATEVHDRQAAGEGDRVRQVESMGEAPAALGGEEGEADTDGGKQRPRDGCANHGQRHVLRPARASRPAESATRRVALGRRDDGERQDERQAVGLIRSNIAAGGMIPKLEACVTALKAGGIAQIIDGRKPLALKDSVAGKTFGTRVG